MSCFLIYKIVNTGDKLKKSKKLKPPVVITQTAVPRKTEAPKVVTAVSSASDPAPLTDNSRIEDVETDVSPQVPNSDFDSLNQVFQEARPLEEHELTPAEREAYETTLRQIKEIKKAEQSKFIPAKPRTWESLTSEEKKMFQDVYKKFDRNNPERTSR